MNTKLTLRLEQSLIQRAKTYAHRRGKSLSQMVAEYFSFLSVPSRSTPPSWPPRVRSLKGLLRKSRVDLRDVRQHWTQKYL